MNPSSETRVSPKKRKVIALSVLLAMFAFGVFFFGPRMPREMQVRFELPPTLRGDGVSFPREDAKSLSAKVFDGERQPVGAVEISLAGLSGPRTSAFVMNLRPGPYAFEVEIKGSRQWVPMHAMVELEGGENFVDLKAGRPR